MFKLITPYSFHDRGLEHQRFILFRLKNISIYVLNKKLKSALENSNLLNSRGNITKKIDLISPPTPTSMIIITWNPLPPEQNSRSAHEENWVRNDGRIIELSTVMRKKAANSSSLIHCPLLLCCH